VNEDTARTVANVLMGAAAIAAAVVILRTPSLRRLAFGLARTAIVSGIPAWLSHEIKRAWEESKTPQPAVPRAS
jgi:hypothetical protein